MLQIDPIVEKYFSDIEASSGLNQEEEVAVCRRIQQGDPAALAELVQTNLRFVVRVAKQYKDMGLSFADLIAEGNVGLIVAAQRFDSSRGFKFISYAVWWIRHAILKALAENARVVRLPTNRVVELSRLGRTKRRLEQKLGRLPAASEMAGEMAVPTENIEVLMELDKNPVSLDSPCEDEPSNRRLVDCLADESQSSSDDLLADRELHSRLQQALQVLSPVEARVLRMYYGLNGGRPMTLEEIGTTFNRTRERMRQIKGQALDKLRRTSRSHGLRDFFLPD
jgi:RNA polymerase primary sigma factor